MKGLLILRDNEVYNVSIPEVELTGDIRITIHSKVSPPPPKGILQVILRSWMERNGLTQVEVASMFGVHQSTVYRWLKGTNYLPAYVSKFIKENT